MHLNTIIGGLILSEGEFVSNIYQFEVTKNDGSKVMLQEFAGKVLLIVNVASECGFTNQYEELETLYGRFKDQGLEVLAFPSNQFGGQEPGTDAEIKSFCETRFKISFPLFQKIEVNGKSSHPLYQFLREAARGVLGSRSIKWNFTKFLVSKNGDTITRYAPNTRPIEMEKDILQLINQ